MELVFPKSKAVVELNLSWFGKRANRLPEALWLTLRPDAPESRNWQLNKVGDKISPFDVISRGNRHMHALSTGLSYNNQVAVESLDAALVVLGERSPIYFSNDQPDLTAGFHFSLFNNGWGTNYVQWFGEDMRFRFRLRTTA